MTDDAKYFKGLSRIIIIAAIGTALSLIGAGIYAFRTMNCGQEASLTPSIIVSPTPTPLDETADWKTYRNELLGIEFRYPEILTLSEESEYISLSHFVEYAHSDPCNFIGKEVQMLNGIDDAGFSLEIINKDLKDAAKASNLEEYVIDGSFKIYPGFIDPYTIGQLDGWSIWMGVEGCGAIHYYFPIEQKKILHIIRDFPIGIRYPDLIEKLALIQSSQEESIFNGILSTLKFLNRIDTSDWKTYRNMDYGFEFDVPPQLTQKTEGNQIIWQAEDESSISLSVEEEVFNINAIPLPPNSLEPEEISIGIDKTEVYVISGGDACYTDKTYYIPKDDYYLVINMSNGGDCYNNDVVSTNRDQILSTFKFILIL